MEFKQAHMKLLQDKTSNLIMIILEDLDAGLMEKELTYYVRTHVYLKLSDKYFWAKLFQALAMRNERHGMETTFLLNNPCYFNDLQWTEL